MSRLRGFIIFIVGVVLIVLGIGIWRSLRIEQEGFLAVWSAIINEMGRLVQEPFALLGIVVMVVGFVVTVYGFRHIAKR